MFRHSEPRNAGARGALKSDLVWQPIVFEHIASAPQLQAAKLARAYRLAPATARAVAELAFDHGRRA